MINSLLVTIIICIGSYSPFINSVTIEGPSFTFGPSAFSVSNGFLYVGAQQLQQNNNFAVMVASEGGKFFLPLAPQTITLNNQKDQPNPLFGAGISQLACWGGNPLVSTTNSTNTLYYYTDIRSAATGIDLSLISLADITDAQGNQAAITKVAGDSDLATTKPNPKNAFAAIGTGAGQGVSLLTLTINDNQKLLSAAPTTPCTSSTPAIYIGSGTQNCTINDLYWDAALERLFIATSVTPNSGTTNGARSIAVGSITDGLLQIAPIAPDTTFTSSSLIGQVDNGVNAITAQLVRTMHTSTKLVYLIYADLNNKVYALPLVNQIGNMSKGTLAAYQSPLTDLFNNNFPYNFLARSYTQPATSPSEIPDSTNIAACIGGINGSSLLPGAIKKMQISTDAVFVSVDGQNGGIFHSQAIFASNGPIINWTTWQRVGGSVGDPSSFAYDPIRVTYWNIYANIASRSAWQQSAISAQFTQDNGGVQTLASFSNPRYNRIDLNTSIIIMGGNNLLSVIQTQGALQQETYQFPDSLPEIGAITSIALWNNLLAIGGSLGVAILATNNGQGWSGQLDSQLSNLNGLAFKTLGNYTNVRKLSFQNNNLYVLTDTQVDRINITANSINKGGAGFTQTLATVGTAPGNPKTFSDMIVAEPVVLLGTTSGLIRSGQSANCATADAKNIDWEIVSLNESPGPVSAFYITTPSGLEYDTAQGSTLYAVATSQSLHKACVYRLYLSGSLLTPFLDYFIKDVPSFFISRGDYRNYITTNGALFELSRSRYLNQPIVFEKLPAQFSCGMPLLGHAANPIYQLPKTGNTIRRLNIDPASGGLIVYGDFGTLINQ